MDAKTIQPNWESLKLSHGWIVTIDATKLTDADLKKLPPAVAFLYPLTGNHRLPQNSSRNAAAEKELQAKQAEIDSRILQTLHTMCLPPDDKIRQTPAYREFIKTLPDAVALQQRKEETRLWLQAFSLELFPELLKDTSGDLQKVWKDLTRMHPYTQLILYSHESKSGLGFSGMQGLSTDDDAESIFKQLYARALEEKFSKNKFVIDIAMKKLHQGYFLGGLMNPLKYYLQVLCEDKIATIFPQTIVIAANSPTEATLTLTYPIRDKDYINEFPIIYTLVFRVSPNDIRLETIRIEIIPGNHSIYARGLYFSYLKEIPGFDIDNLSPSSFGLRPDICQIDVIKKIPENDLDQRWLDYLTSEPVELCLRQKSKIIFQQLDPRSCPFVDFKSLVLDRVLQSLLNDPETTGYPECLEKIIHILFFSKSDADDCELRRAALLVSLNLMFRDTQAGVQDKILERIELSAKANDQGASDLISLFSALRKNHLFADVIRRLVGYIDQRKTLVFDFADFAISIDQVDPHREPVDLFVTQIIPFLSFVSLCKFGLEDSWSMIIDIFRDEFQQVCGDDIATAVYCCLSGKSCVSHTPSYSRSLDEIKLTSAKALTLYKQTCEDGCPDLITLQRKLKASSQCFLPSAEVRRLAFPNLLPVTPSSIPLFNLAQQRRSAEQGLSLFWLESKSPPVSGSLALSLITEAKAATDKKKQDKSSATTLPSDQKHSTPRI